MRANEQQIEEYKLDRAVRLGLEQARRTRSRRGISACRTRIGYGALAAVLLTSLAALLILAPNQNPGGNAAQKGVSGPAASLNPAAQPPDYAMKQIDSHKDWKKALEHGLYQPINQTQEKNGYRVTVDGVLADSKVVIVFYTAENLEGNAPIKLIRSTQLNFGSETGSVGYDNPYFESDPKKASVTFGRFEFFNADSTTDLTPGTLAFSGYWGNEALPEEDQALMEFSFSINPELDKAAVEKTIPINQSVKVAGDTITIKDALMGPLHTWIVVDFSKSLQPIEDLYQPKLTIGTGNNLVHLYAFLNLPYLKMRNEPNKIVLPFEGGIYEKDTSTITLMANGIERSTLLSQQITVNTDTGQIIHAPDDRLKFEGITKQDGQLLLSLSLKPSANGGENYMKQSFDLNSTFTDTKGNEFTFKTPSKTSISADGTANQVTVGLEDRKYNQPLTFTVPFYQGAIIESPITVTGKEETAK
ncbi:DUF4179 domain-containing protein [Paenibacillus physcomitrellae]|nr:DUF4179 domain-containing protein [Paenibacillus physcomitrellae]